MINFVKLRNNYHLISRLNLIDLFYLYNLMGNLYTKISRVQQGVYKNYFDNSTELLCVINQNGYFIKMNDKFINELGYDKKYIYNINFKELIHIDDISSSLQNFIDVKRGKFVCCKNRYLKKNKEYVLLEWKAIRDKYDNILCTAKDITNEIKVQDELIFYKNLLEDSENVALFGSWSWDIKNNILRWSEGLKKIYGLENPTYEEYMNINHPEDREFIQSTINKCLQTMESYEFEHRIMIGTNVKYLFAKGKYIIKDNIHYIQGVLRDITKQHLVEINLVEAKYKAEKASEMKSAFVANISHEIRTPINGIIGMTNILQEHDLTFEQKECLDIILYSSGILLSIINNVLDFSKIEAGIINMEFNNIYLEEFLSNIIDSFKNLLPDNVSLNMYIDKKVPSCIVSDRLKLRQILSNLISNSIKFTLIGSVSIILTVKNDDVLFEIKDTGIGINNEIINNLFQPFIQADSSTTRLYGGTGLGLSICKKLVEILNGSIYIKSNVGIGTSIIFNIKNKIDEIENIKVVSDTNKNIKNNIIPNKIIIVEDNKINQIIIKKSLEKLKYDNYILYKNGRELIDNIYILENASIIFMDIHMPLLDGYETTRILRSKNINNPIIALTANALSGEKEKCISYGMNDFLLKPITLNDLRSMIEKWI